MKQNMQYIRQLWRQFGDVPMDPDTECIETEWNGFPAGTHREDIWHWFEETFNISVAEDLMLPKIRTSIKQLMQTFRTKSYRKF